MMNTQILEMQAVQQRQGEIHQGIRSAQSFGNLHVFRSLIGDMVIRLGERVRGPQLAMPLVRAQASTG